jgi:excisionase family DNA binding protein
MANVDFKLGEWFKQVDRREKELKAKKTPASPSGRESAAPRVEATAKADAPSVERMADRVSPLVVAAIEDAGEVSGVGQVREHDPGPRTGTATLSHDDELDSLEDDKIPQIEDFIPMEDAGGAVAERPVDDIVVTSTDEFEQDRTGTVEGTGTPRPLAHSPAAESVSKAAQPAVQPRPKAEKTPRAAAPAESTDHDQVEAAWKRMPHHLQVLFGVASEEVAQRSYNAFKESRDDMIQRLVDPTLTLEETARLLNVCPTTVRRYTNRGVLEHHRTAGNQRRFRLSDVLGFVEAQNAR